MKVLKFKCELLSDIILNQKFATEGPNQTLDFIPGNNFLGIVAGKLYGSPDTWTIFHSGKVRFGDAHPANGNNRTVRIPSSFYIPKLQQKEKDENKEYYVHHLIPDLQSEKLLAKQLKQCRIGFYDFTVSKAKQVKVNIDFVIKSAYDRIQRRSKDDQMFGYQYISKGLTYFFSIEIEDNKLEDEITEALSGLQRIGRSRSAQYGLVNISRTEFEEPDSSTGETDEVVIYADGRLIFLDEYGVPTCQPTACQLGLDGGEICWEKSQVRTFHYAPYNYKRKCFDTDRCGIEKGSVLVIKWKGDLESLPSYVGQYNNEGFGKVIYNPVFLNADEEGKAVYEPCSSGEEKTINKSVSSENVEFESVLLNYLTRKKTANEIIFESYRKVNEWVSVHAGLFKDKAFASQWGQIRNIAMKSDRKVDIYNGIKAYLSHGVAEEKWKERRRKTALLNFMNELSNEEAQIIMVNLSAEMAKKCREGGKK